MHVAPDRDVDSCDGVLPPTTRRRGWAAAAGALLVVAMAGCAETAKAPEATDRPTSSDVTDVERRARARMELASAYFSRGQVEVALDEVKLALQAKPDLAEGHALRGLIYAAMGEDALAMAGFQQALRLNPRDPDTLHNYGWYLCQRRRYDEAAQHFVAAMAVPRYAGMPRTLLAQGVCEARNERWQDAERTLSRAYELDPSNPVVAFNLSDVLLRRGELERARFYIARVNAVPELVSAQSLWLAARIERRLGNDLALRGFGHQLRNRFPQSPEALQYERGRFDE